MYNETMEYYTCTGVTYIGLKKNSARVSCFSASLHMYIDCFVNNDIFLWGNLVSTYHLLPYEDTV